MIDEAQRKEQQSTFLREHQAKSKTWAPLGGVPFGIPGPAGAGPTQSQDSLGSDNSGLKA